MTEVEQGPWWQKHIGTILRGVSVVIVVVGMIWGGGAWVESQNAAAKSTATTLEKIDRQVDNVRHRVTTTESELKSLVRDNERLYKVSKRLSKAVLELKIVTSELKAIVKKTRN